MADAGWVHGTLVEPPVEDEPVVDPRAATELLDAAEDIVNAIGPDALLEAERTRLQQQRGRRWWQRRHR